MNVEQLINRLQLFPPGAKVQFDTWSSTVYKENSIDFEAWHIWKDSSDNVVWVSQDEVE